MVLSFVFLLQGTVHKISSPLGIQANAIESEAERRVKQGVKLTRLAQMPVNSQL